MGYPEEVLAPDEEVVEHLHPHWITLVPATFWFIVICALTGVGISFAPHTGHLIVAILIAVVALALVTWLSLKPLIFWRTTHFVFTTHRVLIRTGLLRHVGHDIALQRINDVGFVQTLWDRIVRAGTLTIESAGEKGQQTLENIPRANYMQQLLNRLVEEDDLRRARASHPNYPPPQQYPQAPYPPQQYPQGQYPPQQQYPQGQHPPQQQYPHGP